ncbi:MAG: AAA family ATPase [Beijerinckiaceae bacterium]
MNTQTPSEGNANLQIAQIPRVSIQAFCETQATASAINQAAMDRRMSKAHVKVNMGGGAAAIEAYRDSPTPNLLILEGTGDRETLLGHLEQLSELCEPSTKVVIIGPFNDITLYRELMSLGVSEYLCAPVDVINFVALVANLFASTAGKPIGRVIAVMGAKGGVGSSTIAHNLAWSVATSFNMPAILVDFDVAFGTAGLNFNQDPSTTIMDVIGLGERLDQSTLDKVMFRCSEMLNLIVAPATLDTVCDFSEDAFDPFLDLLRTAAPNLILDLPHAWTGWIKSAAMSADEVVVVASPDLPNLRNSKVLLDTLRASRPNDAAPKLVLNMVGAPKRPEIEPSEFVGALDAQAATIIPYDAKLFGSASNNGQMLAETDPSSKINENIAELARRVMSQVAEPPKPAKKSLLAPIGSILARMKKAS